ncbi:MAG TPA: SpoIIE family protein phosphatase [Leptospiraceae bacterium]|nr:SpoIIE family protein phosphatase [Leptospiraceae bacterium]
MKSKFRYFFLLHFLLVCFPIFSVEQVDLLKDCNSENQCKQRPWYIIDNFKEDYIQSDTVPEGSKEIEKFPVSVQKIYPQTESIDFTLRTEFKVSDEYFNEKITTGIYLDAIGDVYTIYLNGKMIGQEGKVENGKVVLSRYGNHIKYPLNFSFFKKDKNILILHIQGNPKFNLTGLFRANGYYLDEYDKILISSRDRTGIILIFLYLFFGAYHLFLYIKRRHETYNLAFSILSLSAFIYLIGRYGLFFEYGLDSTIGYRIELMSVYFIPLSLGIFLELLFFGKIGRYFKGYILYSALLFIVTPFVPQHFIIYVLRAWQISALVSAIFLIYVFKVAIQKKTDSAKRLMLGLTIMIFSAIFDVLDSIFFKTGLILTRFGFFSFIVGIVGILANRFLNLHETVENLNKTLEDKVIQRTKELQETLSQVKLLKEQQDGDYFLTTLIINPLASNAANDEKIDLKILIHQKKKFEFKNRMHEIGGDICILDNIFLKGRKFTAFVNGDAMGKSIQGAGGALVLGVVFKSIVSRARFTSQDTVYPERWLKMAFQELQSVFQSFDGSMMISVVMGLIDNDRGFIYYINAEHPFSVLFRDNKASFIEKEMNLRKIGIMTEELSGDFQVNTFKLEHDDVVIMGSDGRDDIKIGMDDFGLRLINEDENLFLKTVEQANADLEKIFYLTQTKGELIDDYSLLRIEYKNTDNYLEEETNDSLHLKELYESGNISEAEKIIEKLLLKRQINRTVLKIRANIAYSKGNFAKAGEYFSEYLDLFPEETNFLFIAANCYKQVGKLESAADYAERLKLREPRNVSNLILLTEIYIALKNIHRATAMLKNAKLVDRNNPRVLELDALIHQIDILV